MGEEPQQDQALQTQPGDQVSPMAPRTLGAPVPQRQVGSTANSNKMPPVISSIDRLARNNEQLEKLLSMLEDKLQPITVEMPHDAIKEDTTGGTSAITQAIDAQAGRIRNACARISRLLDTVDL